MGFFIFHASGRIHFLLLLAALIVSQKISGFRKPSRAISEKPAGKLRTLPKAEEKATPTIGLPASHAEPIA
jgi:hypothetical protein